MAGNEDRAHQWEWNPFTGDPVHPPQDSPNERYRPTLVEIDEMADARRGTTDGVKEQLREFMTSNRTHMTTTFDVSKNSDDVRHFLTLLRRLDFKKIRATYRGSGIMQLEKLDRETPLRGELDLELNPLRNKQSVRLNELVSDNNFNALHGFLGPGTFPCFKTSCNLCTHVGKTATVRLGSHGELSLNKRATCSMKNAVYVGVCLKCEEEGTFTCYFGESNQALHKRYTSHFCQQCNPRSILKSSPNFRTLPNKQVEVARVIAAGEDPNETLRDWFAHVTTQGVHPGYQQISVVDVIPNTFRRKNRERNLVEERMWGDDDIDYLGMGKGCLNTYYDI